MALIVTTDPERIVVLLDRLLAQDPIRNTILGTLRSAVFDIDSAAWAAATADGQAVAARSHTAYPLTLAGSWTRSGLTELTGYLGEVTGLSGFSGTTDQAEALARALGLDTSAPGRCDRQRLFRLDELSPPLAVSGRARRADAGDRALVLGWYQAFAVEAGARSTDVAHHVDAALAAAGCWLWLDAAGRPVSMAVRRPAVSGSARIGPVYTPPDARGRGYGSAATAAASADVLGGGAVPVLFTDLANPVSNAIYPRLGYVPVQDRLVVRLG